MSWQKIILNQGEIDKLQLRLDALKYGINNDDDNEGRGSGGGGGGGDDGTPGPGPLPPRTPQQEMDESVRRLDLLRGNTLDVSPDNTMEQNSRIIAQKNQERFQNRWIKEREAELLNIPKGIINKRKSSINFNFPDTPPYTPSEDFSRSFNQMLKTIFHNTFNRLCISLNQRNHEKQIFLFSDGNQPKSLSPLRNKLRNIAPLPSKPTIDNFARPITQITDEKNNTIAITPKRPVPKIEERNLSEQLQSIFPDVNETITKESEIFKEKIEDLDTIIEKVSNIDDDQDEQKILSLSFSLEDLIQNLIRLFGNLDFQVKI